MSVSFTQERLRAVLFFLTRRPQDLQAPTSGVVGVKVPCVPLKRSDGGEPESASARPTGATAPPAKADKRRRRVNNPGCYDNHGHAIAGRRATNRSKQMLATKRRIGGLHARAADACPDAVHKPTHQPASGYAPVAVEDPAVGALRRAVKRSIRRAIHGAAHGEIRRHLPCKTSWHGGQPVLF